MSKGHKFKVEIERLSVGYGWWYLTVYDTIPKILCNQDISNDRRL